VTAIAYRDGVMASDSLAECHNIVMGSVRKIIRRADGALAGSAGMEMVCAEFMRRFAEGTDADFRPELKDESDFSAIVVTPDGQIWQVNMRGRFPISAPFYVDGSAYQVMIGAMAAGASAEEAVEIAIKYDTRCGGPIQVERLGG